MNEQQLPKKPLSIFDNCPRGFEDELMRLMDDYARAALAANVPAGFVLVNAGALQMVRNALQRDADDGRSARGEMLAELDAVTKPAPAQAQQAADDYRRGYEACVDSYKEAQLASYPLVTSWSASRGRVWIKFEDGSDELEFEAAPAAPAQAKQPRPFGGGSLPTSAAERHLRRLLAVRVGMPHTYFDDGEAQGNEHGISIDFMREPVEHIDAKLRALNVARAECAKPEAQQSSEADEELCRQAMQRWREAKPEAQQPLHITVLIDWLAVRYRAAGGKEGITDLSAFCEEVMRWTEHKHGIGASGEAKS